MSGLADTLREAADLIAAHPELPTPCVWGYGRGAVTVQWQLMNRDDAKDDQRAAAVAIRQAVGGEWSKEGYGQSFKLTRNLGTLSLEILADREQVCERIVVGTKTVTVPAVEAQPAREVEVEDVEWRCEQLLAGASA